MFVHPPGVEVAVIDVPALGAFGVAAAAKGGHAPLKRGPHARAMAKCSLENPRYSVSRDGCVSETIVHADAHNFVRDSAARPQGPKEGRRSDGHEGVTDVAEVDVEIFKLAGPTSTERGFHARARHPPGPGLTEVAGD